MDECRCQLLQAGAGYAAKFSYLMPSAAEACSVAVLVFSMTDRASFLQLPALRAVAEALPCILVATKCDDVSHWMVTMVRFCLYAATLDT
jgi:hypothetical protein